MNDDRATRFRGAGTLPFGFNVISYVSSDVGVGVHARHLVRLLLKRQCPVAIFDMDPGLGRQGANSEFAELVVKKGEDLPYSINLVLLFIPALPGLFLDPPPNLFRAGRLNVAIIVWELPALPRVWIEALQLFDVLIAPSNFVRSILEMHLADARIVHGPHAIYTPAPRDMSRIRAALPEGAVVFGASFEPHSDPQRKNPYAAIEAYNRAFPSGHPGRLIIKVHNAAIKGDILPDVVVRDLQNRCGANPGIQLITDPMTYEEVMGFYAACDVFVSLHRAEGLALGPMEAMLLGKPVIATGWSGNMTYMDYANSCLVGYRFIPAEGSAPVYTARFLGGSTFWADPEIGHAAAWMKRLASDPELRARIGERAGNSMRAYRERAEQAHFIEEIAAIAEQAPFIEGNRERYRELGALRKAQVTHTQSRTKRSLRMGKELLDRHVLWRLRSRAGS